MTQDDWDVQRDVMWEQAKGQLRAISASYVGRPEAYQAWNEELEAWIAKVEDNAIGGFR